jgi:hypothetical protein
MKSVMQIPGSLAIVKLDERHYQLTDTSVPSIGVCLGVFPTHAAAESFATKITEIRSRDHGKHAEPAEFPSMRPPPPADSRVARTVQPVH